MLASSRTWGSLLLSLLVLTTPAKLKSADLDRDGIDDTFEETLARGFMPMIWYDSGESCPDPGVALFHVRPFIPGGSTDTLALTYSIPYYEDCGTMGHRFDLESFALTLYPLDGSPYGYGVHSIKTWAHRNSACEVTEVRAFDPPLGVAELSSDTLYSSWGDVLVADDKHGLYLDEGTCDGHCGVDDCERYRLMNDSRLVPSDQGQFFYVYNIGEINDHLIEGFAEINEDGFTFDPRYVWGSWWMDENYLSVADGPALPVSLGISNFPYPNPIRPCADNSVGLDLGYRSVIRMQVFDAVGGELRRDEFLGEFCAGDDVDLHLWDGYDGEGHCLSTGRKIVRITGYRGGNSSYLDAAIDIAGDPVDRPAAPTALDLSLIDDHVHLQWTDNADDEEGFFVERREDSCDYEYLVFVDPHAGTGTVAHEDHDIVVNETYGYRVFAVGDGGYSATTDNHTVTIPECAAHPNAILGGPTIEADTVFSAHLYPVSVEVSDPGCAFTRYAWTVSGNSQTDPGTIIGTGDRVDYLAPAVDCDPVDYPAYQNKIDVTASYQGDSESGSTGWFLIHCPPPDTSGCPFLHVWNGRAFVPENNLLPSSEVASEVNVDRVLLRNRPVADVRGEYVLEIREDNEEHSFLDAVELRFVDRIPSAKVGVTRDGKVFTYREIAPPLGVRDSKGRDRLEAVRDVDGITLHGTRGEEASLSFAESGPGIVVMYVIAAPRVKRVGPIIVPKGEDSRWGGPARGVGFGLPRHLGGPQFLSIPSPPVDSKGPDITLVWTDEVEVDCVAMIAGRAESVDPGNATLVEALHSARGDITDRIRETDGAFAELRPGERIRLAFSAPEPSSGTERDFMLVTRGYYVK